MLRKITAGILSFALVLTSAGAPQWAHAVRQVPGDEGPPGQTTWKDDGPKVDPDKAKTFFEANGVFQGKEDNFRSFLFNQDGSISPIGTIYYRYLAESANSGTSEPPDAETIRKRIEYFSGAADSMRKLGKATPEMRAKAAAKMQELKDEYFKGAFTEITKELSQGRPDGLSLRMQLKRAFDGAAAAVRSEEEFVMVETPDGYLWLDGKGEAVRKNKNMVCTHSNWSPDREPLVMSMKRFASFEKEQGDQYRKWDCNEGEGVTIFNRVLREQQKNMNDVENKPACAPRIPLTGRYNFEMLKYSECRLEEQVIALEQAVTVERLMNLAQMIGENPTSDQLAKDDKYNHRLKKSLEEKARKWSLKDWTEKDARCPNAENVLDYVNCKYSKTRGYLTRAKEILAKYKARVESFRGRQIITDADISGLQRDEKMLSVQISNVFLGVQENQARNQLEALSYEIFSGIVRRTGRTDGKNLDGRSMKGSWLTEWAWKMPGLPGFLGGEGLLPVKWKDYESPDSKYFRENLEGTDWSEEKKKAYDARRRGLALKLGRLIIIYQTLEKKLNDADHATGLGDIQSVLQATQKELVDVGANLTIFLTLPALSQVAKEESSSWNFSKQGVLGGAMMVNAAQSAANSVSKFFGGGKLFDGAAVRRYIDDRAEIERLLPAFDRMAGLIGEGKFEEARRQLIAVYPDALKTSWSAPVFGGGPQETTDPMRVQAAFQKAQKTIMRVAKVNMWADTIANLAIWSVALGVAAPAVSVVANGVGRGLLTAGTALVKAKRLALVVRPMGYSMRFVGSILEHAAIRLKSLSPASTKIYGNNRVMRQTERIIVQTANAGARLGGFATLAGGISAGFGAGMYGYDKAFGDGNNPMPSAWEAAKVSGLHGAKWAMEDWHPMLLFAGLPSTAFDGIKGVSGVANSIAHRGVFGNLSALTRNAGGLAGKGIGKWGRGASMLERAGRARVAIADVWGIKHAISAGKAVLGNPLVVMGDHVAKFIVVSQGAGLAAKHLSLNYNTVDEGNIERRLKRAEQAKMHHMEAPWWLLLPIASARTEMVALSHSRTRQGVKEYLESGEGYRLAEMIPEITKLALKSKPKVPLMQRFFNMRWRGETGDTGTFKITKELHHEVIQKVLPGEIAGASGGKVVPVSEAILRDLFNISHGKKGTVGRLKVTDVVKDQAGELFIKQVGKSIKLRRKILDIAPENLGKTVKGYGTVDAKVQKVFARSIWHNSKNAKYKVSEAEFAKAKKILEAELSTELKVENAAREALKALKKNANPSRQFKDLVEGTLEDITAWKNGDKKLNDLHGEDYMSLIKEFKAKAARLSTAERNVASKVLDYLTTIRERFNYFNKVEVAAKRAELSLQSRVNQLEDGQYGKDVPRLLKRMKAELDAWKLKQKNKDAPVGKEFETMVEKLSKEVQAHKDILSKTDYKFLESSVKELESAPWILRDSKGTNLKDWRPEQVEGLMYFLGSVMTKGTEAAQTVRTFLMMKTGAGKTFLAYEGLLPFAEAVAKDSPRGLKTIFLTVQSNLESQARLEFRAMNKLRTRLEFDTWEGFKSKIAQGKLDFRMKPEDYFILGDEMDGAALQPALTIGETTATIGRWSVGYQKLKPTASRLLEVLNRGALKLRAQIEGVTYRQRSFVDVLAEGAAKESLMGSTRKIIRQASKLNQLNIRTFKSPSSRAQALHRARGILRRLANRGRKGGAPEIPETRWKKKTQGYKNDIEIQKRLIENPQALKKGAARFMKELRALRELAKLEKSKFSQLSKQMDEVLARLETKVEKLKKAGNTVEAEQIETRMKNFLAMRQIAEGLDAKALIARLQREMKAYLKEIALGRKSTVEAEPPLAKLVEDAVNRFGANSRQGKALKALSDAIAKLEAVDTAVGLRNRARALREKADVLAPKDKEAIGKTNEWVETLDAKAVKYRQWAKEVIKTDKGRARKLIQDAISFEAQAKTGRKTAIELGKVDRPGANKLVKEAEALERRATEIEANPKVFSRAMDGVTAKLRQHFELDTAVERGGTTKKIRSLIKSQDAQLKKMDSATAKKFKNSQKELNDILDNQEAISRVDRDTAMSLHQDMMALEKSVMAQTPAAGAKLAKKLTKMAKAADRKGQTATADKLKTQAKEVKVQGEAARKELKANSEEVDAVLKEGKKGWEGRARELLKKREGIIERSVEKQNPIYEIFREMRESMYPHVHSARRVTQEFQTLEHAPRSARNTLLKNSGRVEGSVKGLVKELTALRARGKPVKGQLAKAKELLTKVNRNGKELRKARRDLKNYKDKTVSDDHEALFKAGRKQELLVNQAEAKWMEAEHNLNTSPGDKKLKTAAKASEKEFHAANKTLNDINSKMAKFNETRRIRLEKKIEGFERNAETFQKEVEGGLANFTQNMPDAKTVQPKVDAIVREVRGATRRWGSEKSRIKMTPEKAERILSRRIDGVSAPKMLMTYALEIPRLAVHKIFGKSWKGVRAREGLTRQYARRLLWNFLRDPLITPDVRWRMFWTLLPDILFSRGTILSGRSWVQGELYNLARGYVEPSSTIRFNHGTGKVNVVHNGQWFESMDTPTRRFWELEYGADLTLPYNSQTISTIKDITTNTKARFIGFSGTAGAEFRARLVPYKITLTGKGSEGATNMGLEMHASPAGKMKSITRGLRRSLLHDFEAIEVGGQADSLLVLSLPDTRIVKQVIKHLTRNGLSFSKAEISPKVLRSLIESGFGVKPTSKGYTVTLKELHIAKVISDAELLRTQMPKANIEAQLNLNGLSPGRVKILILDTRVGGRGLDLNFKGMRGRGPFKGYNHFEMQIHDPQVASEAHFLQAQGRIDIGRINKGAVRTFKMVMDIPSSSKEVVFLKMLRDEPLMAQLRNHPEVVRRANARGKIHPEWVDIHRYMEDVKIRVTKAKAGGNQKTAQAYQDLFDHYEFMIRRNLEAQKLEIEKDQLRSSSVLQDQAMYNWLNRALYPSMGRH